MVVRSRPVPPNAGQYRPFDRCRDGRGTPAVRDRRRVRPTDVGRRVRLGRGCRAYRAPLQARLAACRYQWVHPRTKGPPCAHSHLSRSPDRRARRADRAPLTASRPAGAATVSSSAGVDRQLERLGPQLVADDRRRQRRRPQRHRHRARERAAPRHQRGDRPRPRRVGRSRPAPRSTARPRSATSSTTVSRRSSSASARRWCRTSRAASGSTTPTARCTARSAPRDYFNIWTNNPHPDGYADGVFSSPAIGDVNGDGYPDIVFGGFDLHVHAIDRNCHEILSDNIEDTVWSSPALYDVNGDGRLDILIGGDQIAGRRDQLVGRRVPRHRVDRRQHAVVLALPRDLEAPAQRHDVVEPRDRRHRRRRPARGRRRRRQLLQPLRRPQGLRLARRRRLARSRAGRSRPAARRCRRPRSATSTATAFPRSSASSADGWVRAYNGNGSLLWATHLWHVQPGAGRADRPRRRSSPT